jgi:hypothetical protein
MELKDVVLKLTGSIRATGVSEFDEDRLANLKELTELVNDLIFEIGEQVPNASRAEYSMRAIGKHSLEFLRETRDMLAGDEGLREGEQ